MAKKKNQLEDLAKELENYSIEVAKNLAIKSREILYKSADSAIRSFYEHYSPIYYERHTPISYNIRKSFKKYYKKMHEHHFSGGIEISPDWMDDIYRADKDYIFNLIYAGYHGNIPMIPWEQEGTVPYIPPVMKPSPLELILNAKDIMIRNMNYLANKTASEVRAKNNYQFIK